MIKIRQAKAEDIKNTVELINNVFRTTGNYSMGKQFPLFLSEENAKNLFIAEDNGEIVAHNGIKRQDIFIHGHKIAYASMGAVCTHPDYRGQGIATKILNKIFEYLNKEDIGLLTISGGRGLYIRNGAVFSSGKYKFLIEDDFLNLKELHSGLSYSKTFNTKIDYCEGDIPENIDDIANLYLQKSVRYKRNKSDFPTLLTAMPSVHEVPYPPEFVTATITIRGAILAYIIGYFPAKNKFKTIEYAGESKAVLELLQNLKADYNIKKIKLEIPAHDQQLYQHLTTLSLKSELGPYDITYKLINAETLWNDLLPAIRELNPDKNFTISFENLPVNPDNEEEFVSFLFDVVDRKQYGQPWDKIFPLPLPWPKGLNYI